jgi:DNA-directed RNA polymerase specialized sigma24 family protein
VPADVLGASRNAVYKALFEARRKLRATLTPTAASRTLLPGP